MARGRYGEKIQNLIIIVGSARPSNTTVQNMPLEYI